MAKIRDFNTITSMIDRGGFIAEVNAKLAEVVAKLADEALENPKRKTKGSVAVTVALEVQNGIVTIAATCVAKKPKEDPRSTLLWLTSDGDLTNEHPTQIDMFRPRDVDGEAAHA